MSLWSLLAAPLFFSGDMTKIDDFTQGILCNHEVIDVNQDPLGRQGRRIAKQGDTEVWSKPLADGSMAVGLFNRGDTPAEVTALWTELGLSGEQTVRDLWRQKNLGRFQNTFSVTVARHGVEYVRIGAL